VAAEPIVIKGLGRYLELKQMSLKQKAEAMRREKEAFQVKNVDKYRRIEDGSTIVEVCIIIDCGITLVIYSFITIIFRPFGFMGPIREVDFA